METDVNSTVGQNQDIPIKPPVQKKHLKVILLLFILIILISIISLGYYFFNKKINDSFTESPIQTESPVESIEKKEIPAISKAVFKSKTEEYLNYKYLIYDIKSRQLNDLSLPINISTDTKYSVANDLKHYFIATGKELYISSTEDLTTPQKVFTIPSTETKVSVFLSHAKWSLDGSHIVFSTSKFSDKNETEENLYTISNDGTNLKLVKTINTNKFYTIPVYDSKNSAIYMYSFIDDNGIFKGSTDIIDANNGSVKGKASLMDNNGIVDDIIFSPDMRYAFYRKVNDSTSDQESPLTQISSLQLIQHDLKTSSERALYTYGKDGGNFLLSIPSHQIIIIDFKKGFTDQVKLLDYETNKEELLFSSSQYPYNPISISPDGRYLWLSNFKDDSKTTRKPTYAIYNLNSRVLTPINIPENITVELAPMEIINWLP